MTFTPPKTLTIAIPFLERLSVEIELVRYDRPLCALLRDASGRLYLGHFLDCSDAKEEFWYLVPIDRDTVPRLLTGQMALQEALIMAPEEFRLVGHVSSRSEHELSFSLFQQSPDVEHLRDYLPNSSFRFFDDEFEAYLSQELEPIVIYAKRRLAEVIYLRLVGPGILPNLFPLSQLAEIGRDIQRLITNLAMYEADPNSFGRRGPARLSVEHASQFALTGIAAGSVQLRLESIQQAELIEEFSPAFSGARVFTELCGSEEPAQVCQALRQYPPRIRSNYLSYMIALQSAHAGMKLEWGTPKRAEPWISTWSLETVIDIASEVSKMSIQEEHEFEVKGFFIEGSMRSRRFKLLDISTGRTITGHIAPEVETDVLTLSRETNVAVLYNVVIRETITTTPADTTSYQYTFLDVQKITIRNNNTGGLK